MKESKKVYIKPLNSCQMRNQKILQYQQFLLSQGYSIADNIEKSDLLIIWTCAFRGDVLELSLSEIERYQNTFKGEVIVAGCLPDIAPELLKTKFSGRILNWRDDENKLIDFFGGNRSAVEQSLPVYGAERLCENTEKYRKENPDKDATFHDQFIKLVVSEGCGFQCAYCSERLMFPPYRSFPVNKLVGKCRMIFEKTGVLEVILLADSLGEYGRDIGTDLPTLIHELKTIHPDIKIALSNLNLSNFMEFYDDMSAFLKNGTFRHLNLPIQSASPKILKLMNRTYTRKDMERIFQLLNESAFQEFDTHIIIGFPGETEEDFDETLDFILRHKVKYVLASTYLEIDTMPSAKLPDKVSPEIIKTRIKKCAEIFQKAGIIYNVSDGKLMKDRLYRLTQKNI